MGNGRIGKTTPPRRIVLVGTYRGDQLKDWPGWYCWPLGKEDFKCCQCENVANRQSQLPMQSMGQLATGNNGNGNTSIMATLAANHPDTNVINDDRVWKAA